MPIDSEYYSYIAEEKQIIDTKDKQRYLTKAIDEGRSYATIKCQIDVDDFRASMFIGYNNGSNTVSGTAANVLPSGWTIVDRSSVTIRRTIELEGPNALDVLNRCAEVYGVCFRFDNNAKILTIINPDNYEPVGAFITEDLNLTELNYKGKSSDIVTRIYAVGKDGLTFADINNGKNYVDDNRYTNKIISYYWKDDRYTDKASLLADAKKKLKAASVPLQSYECNIIDLANTNPEKYGFQDFSLFQVATLISKKKGTRVNHQVVGVKNYPYYPDRNEITLSTVAPSIQSQVKNIEDSLTTPNSGFQQRFQALLNTLGESISGELGGNMLTTYNENGKPSGIKIMDTDDEKTAQKILWLNLSGIAYSSNGGTTFNSVWSFEKGGFIADWLVAGTITANLIKAGILQSNDGKSFWNLDTGEMSLTGSFESSQIAGDGHTYTVKNHLGQIESIKDGVTTVKIYSVAMDGDSGLIQFFKNGQFVTGIGESIETTGLISGNEIQVKKLAIKDKYAALNLDWSWDASKNGFILIGRQ